MRLWTILLALLLPCLATARAAVPAAAVRYRVTGVVISTRDGSPVPYCHLQATAANAEALTGPANRVRREPDFGGEGRRGPDRRETPSADGVTADAHGRFQLDLPGAGAWQVVGSARGYRRQDYDAHDYFFSAIVVTPAAPTMEIVFRLSPDAEINGLLTDEAGEPVENATVVAEFASAALRSGLRQAGSARTDDRGRYEIGGLAPGDYRLRVQAQVWYAQGSGGRFFPQRRGSTPAAILPEPSLDLVYPIIWYPGTDDEAAAQSVGITGGEERQIDFHLLATPAAHIRLPTPQSPVNIDGGNRPRPQRGVSVTRVSGGATGLSQMITTSEQELDFGGLSPGLYEIRTQSPDGRGISDVRQIQILPGVSGIVDVTSARTLTKVTVKVEGEPLGRADDVLFKELATGRTTAVNQELMMQRFSNLRVNRQDDDADRVIYLLPGRYEVILQSYSGSYLTGLSATGAGVKGATVDIGSSAPTVSVRIGNGRAEVSGVARLDATPAAGAMVLLVPATLGDPDSSAEIVRQQTNTDGSYRVLNITPGRYILLVIADGWGLNWRDAGTLAPYLVHGVPLDLQPGAKIRQELKAVKP